jgi:hypothetical protein
MHQSVSDYDSSEFSADARNAHGQIAPHEATVICNANSHKTAVGMKLPAMMCMQLQMQPYVSLVYLFGPHNELLESFPGRAAPHIGMTCNSTVEQDAGMTW